MLDEFCAFPPKKITRGAWFLSVLYFSQPFNNLPLLSIRISSTLSSVNNLYKAVETDDFGNYEFVCFELEPLKLAICDAFIDDTNLEEHIMDDEYSIPVKALYINLIPKNNNCYLFIGYDKKNISNALIELLGKWKSALKKGMDIKVLYDIICHCSNNWCISPDCDRRIIEYLENNYSNDRMDVIF